MLARICVIGSMKCRLEVRRFFPPHLSQSRMQVSNTDTLFPDHRSNARGRRARRRYVRRK